MLPKLYEFWGWIWPYLKLLGEIAVLNIFTVRFLAGLACGLIIGDWV